MYKNKFKSSQNLFFKGYKLVTESTFFLGFFLVALAGLIFMFPAIIGTLFATFILLAGISILVTRYFFWKTKVDQSHNLSALNTEFNFLNHSYNPSRYYRFQNIRFIRW